MDILINKFARIMQTLNEKKDIITKAYPDKSTKVERILNNRMIVAPSQYILQRKVGYDVAQNVHFIPPYKRPRSKAHLTQVTTRNKIWNKDHPLN